MTVSNNDSTSNGTVAVPDDVASLPEGGEFTGMATDVDIQPEEGLSTDVDISGTVGDPVAPESEVEGCESGDSSESQDVEDDLQIALPTNDDGNEGKTFDESLTNPESWVGNSPIKSDYISLKKQGEELFGHASRKIMKYVTFMYLVRAIMLKESKWADNKGEKFKRADFIKKVRDYLLFTSSIPRSMIEPSPWLQMVGFMELMRAKVDDHTGKYVFPHEAPGEDFFAGNLNYSTMRALAPLVKVEKVESAYDVYGWVPGGVTVAREMVRGLRNGSIPNSVSYVIGRRDAMLKKEQAALALEKEKELSGKELDRYLAKEREKLEDARDNKLKSAVKALEKTIAENKFSDDEVKSRLLRSRVIDPVSAADVASIMQNESNQKAFANAIVQDVSNRKTLVAELARTATHQDITDLFAGIVARLKANPRDAATQQCLKSFATCGEKIRQMQAQRAAS